MHQLVLHKVASRILQPLGQPAMALAISAVVLVLGVAALIAIWVVRPPVDRAEYVSEATFAATVLGFMVAVITLLGAAEESRAARAGPDLSVLWLAEGEGDYVPISAAGRDGKTTEYKAVGSTMNVSNNGERIVVNKVSMMSSVWYYHDYTASAASTFRAEPDGTFYDFFWQQWKHGGWDLVWEQDPHYRKVWTTTVPFTLANAKERDGARSTISLPSVDLQVTDADVATDFLRQYHVRWITSLVMHTSRGEAEFQLHKILVIEDDWEKAGKPKKAGPSINVFSTDRVTRNGFEGDFITVV